MSVLVTATLNDPSGAALTGNAFVRFRLRGFTGFVPRISGTSVLCETQIDAPPTAGAISQAIVPNNSITPANTWYTIELWNGGRITSSGNYVINGATNLNTAAQVNAPSVPAGFLLVLENNGTLNSSQSVLNLESTDDSISIVDEGGGTLDLRVNSGATGVTPYLGQYNPSGEGTNFSLGQTGPASIALLPVEIDVNVTAGHITFYVSNVDGSNLSDVGLYTLAGQLVFDIGPTLITPAQTQAYAFTQGTVNIKSGIYLISLTSVSDVVELHAVGLANVPFIPYTTVNTSVGGQLPANITVVQGAPRNADNSFDYQVPFILY